MDSADFLGDGRAAGGGFGRARRGGNRARRCGAGRGNGGRRLSAARCGRWRRRLVSSCALRRRGRSAGRLGQDRMGDGCHRLRHRRRRGNRAANSEIQHLHARDRHDEQACCNDGGDDVEAATIRRIANRRGRTVGRRPHRRRWKGGSRPEPRLLFDRRGGRHRRRGAGVPAARLARRLQKKGGRRAEAAPIAVRQAANRFRRLLGCRLHQSRGGGCGLGGAVGWQWACRRSSCAALAHDGRAFSRPSAIRVAASSGCPWMKGRRLYTIY
jgi:hypothetical protein